MNDHVRLWKGLQSGDKSAFLQLYSHYYHTLFFIGFREMRDADLVKDAIQQLFLSLWEGKGGKSDVRDVHSYLVISLLRKLTADWKRNVRYQHLALAWSSKEDVPAPTPEEYMIKQEEISAVNSLVARHINALPARQRELIMMRFYEGLSYDEIVEKTGLAYRTVYNKIHEAVKKLREDIKVQGNAYGEAIPLVFAWLTAHL